MKLSHSAHSQADFDVRFEWGLVGAQACAAPLTVVVDVLSFTTTLSVAVDGYGEDVDVAAEVDASTVLRGEAFVSLASDVTLE